MFEQSTLNNGPAGARAWTTFFGLTTQVALVSFAMLVPMVWPQVLPTAHLLETLTPPLPPAPPTVRDVTNWLTQVGNDGDEVVGGGWIV